MHVVYFNKSMKQLMQEFKNANAVSKILQNRSHQTLGNQMNIKI